MRSAEPVAWVLNLDAEDELSRPGAHTPTAAATARITGLLPRLAGLVRPTDVVVWPGRRVSSSGASDANSSAALGATSGADSSANPSASARGLEGRAWCPTRWALSQLAAAGARVPPAPPMDVLRRVNHRRFAFELGAHLPAGGFVESEEALLALLADRDALTAATSSGWWLLKRPFGYAGRGRKKVRPEGPSADERAWIRASLESGQGLLVEPLVDRRLDCALHGWLEADGALTLGRPTVQEVDELGTWRASRLATAGELHAEELDALVRAVHGTATALHAAGYFGPFGLDAYRWLTPSGERRFQPRSELNARFSMGYAVGLPWPSSGG